MTGPSWLAGAFAAVMIATAVYCAGRIAVARWQRRPAGYDIDTVHVLMGTAMAGMLVPGLRFGPAAGWEIVFGAAAVWFGWQAWRTAGRRGASRPGPGHRPAQHGQHLLACLAMLYMLLAAGPAASGPAASQPGAGLAMAAGTSTHLRTLALLLALALIGGVITAADRLTALPLAAAGAAARPGPAASCAQPASGDGVAATAARPATRAPALSPRLAACCDIAMGITMGYLLVLMISA